MKNYFLHLPLGNCVLVSTIYKLFLYFNTINLTEIYASYCVGSKNQPL